jgi:hypothetical protein
MNPMMNPMGQRPAGSLGFPRMGGPAQSPPIMAPGAAPPGNTGIVPPAPAAVPAAPQNVPASVVTAGGPAPTGVMPMSATAVPGEDHHHRRDHQNELPQAPGQRIPGLVARMPGMVDLLHQYFAGGGNMRDVRQQFRGAMHDYNQTGQPGSIFVDSMHGGSGLTDYLKAHLTMPPATGGA